MISIIRVGIIFLRLFFSWSFWSRGSLSRLREKYEIVDGIWRSLFADLEEAFSDLGDHVVDEVLSDWTGFFIEDFGLVLGEFVEIEAVFFLFRYFLLAFCLLFLFCCFFLFVFDFCWFFFFIWFGLEP